jgi:putative membrane protein insertion efficiency factor
MNLPALALLALVRAYQYTLRPLLGGSCRFVPSCSDYAIEALRQHGALRGSILSLRRILRCNPWHKGGLDMVPGRTEKQRCGCSLRTDQGHVAR